VSYVPSVIISQTTDRAEDEKLVYPVAGPWMDWNKRDCNARTCNNEDLNKVLLIADGVAQGLGALGILTSLVIPEKTTRNWYLIGNNVFVAPSRVGRDGYGMGATGAF
jgi:hypothetical protein